ncbi:Sec-independent protein translocase protein TatB [Microbulbifer sp. SAOS-129_SWC]|uniref:Sec-independent protein translocase protein TatB n=1 Tax=Microbulbifer sp. SAOS-129_SWC TaxID=3145235 RepID=UPI003216D8F8
MFDIGFFELLLVGVVALVVIGPERLPDAVRTTARWWSGLKRTLHNAREELEKEIGADDIRRELHNERIMRELEDSRREMEQAFSDTGDSIRESVTGEAATAEPAARSHPTAEAEDFLPEQEEGAEELEDPEYPEHWHDYGDPDLNPDHPDHAAAKPAEADAGADEQPQHEAPPQGNSRKP